MSLLILSLAHQEDYKINLRVQAPIDVNLCVAHELYTVEAVLAYPAAPEHSDEAHGIEEVLNAEVTQEEPSSDLFDPTPWTKVHPSRKVIFTCRYSHATQEVLMQIRTSFSGGCECGTPVNAGHVVGNYAPDPAEYPGPIPAPAEHHLQNEARKIRDAVPAVDLYNEDEYECPDCGREEDLWISVIHLNDEHRWSREAIADWLESVAEEHGLDLAFPVPDGCDPGSDTVV